MSHLKYIPLIIIITAFFWKCEEEEQTSNEYTPIPFKEYICIVNNKNKKDIFMGSENYSFDSFRFDGVRGVVIPEPDSSKIYGTDYIDSVRSSEGYPHFLGFKTDTNYIIGPIVFEGEVLLKYNQNEVDTLRIEEVNCKNSECTGNKHIKKYYYNDSLQKTLNLSNEELIDSIKMQNLAPPFMSDKKPVVFTLEKDV